MAGFAECRQGRLLWNREPPLLHYLGHADGIRSGLTVLENLQLAAELAQQPITKVPAMLELMQLTAAQHTQTKYLSAGQKRRVALCKIFLIERALWILDEPLTALDIQTQRIVITKIKDHLSLGGICVMTSHQALPENLPQMKRLELISC
jgi:heme exporter protein A